MPYSQKLLQANNAQTTLAATVNTTQTSITLGAGQGALFPNPGAGEGFVGTFTAAGTTTDSPNEIVLCTARSGDTLTIVRAQEGTTAQNWAIGDNFGNWNTAGTMEQFAQLTDLQSQFTNSAADTGTANAGAVALSPIPLVMSQLLYAPITVLKIGSPNTGAYTLNINSLGALAVEYQGAALIAGDLPASQLFTVRYDGTVLELLTPPANVRSGPPNGAAGGDLTGTYPNPTIATSAVTLTKMATAASSAGVLGVLGASGHPAYNNQAALLSWLGALPVSVALFANQQGSGGGSGETLGAGGYTQRQLNATLLNTISGASLSGAEITLPAGSYLAIAFGASQASGNVTNYTHMLRLHNDTANLTVASGLTNGYAGGSNVAIVPAMLLGGFVAGSSAQYRLDSWVSTACDGGNPINSGENDIFAAVAFIKVA